MKKVAILAQKGGAGKTTIAIHLSVLAMQRDIASCVIDCDPQQSALGWYEEREDSDPPVVDGHQPSGRRPDKTGTLARLLRVAEMDEYDLTIIDTAPHAAEAIGEAARAADFCIVPCRPAILDLKAISKTIKILSVAETPFAVLLNSCPPKRGVGENSMVKESRDLLLGQDIPLFKTAVTQRAAFSHALIDGRAVTEFAPDSPAADEIGGVLNELLEFMK